MSPSVTNAALGSGSFPHTEGNTARSAALFAEAKNLLPGGVNSPVRSFRAVGGQPRFIARGQGAHIFDVDGNEYIDYIGSWGPLVAGHAHPQVVAAIGQAAANGTSYGAPSPLEVEMARFLTQAFPSLDMVRMVNSGTEATMSAIRAARGYTGRNKVVKFTGCYHGHADSFLVKAGSGALTLGTPDSPGVPQRTVAETITVPYNDLSAVEQAFANYPEDIAAVIVEPVAGNMGVVPPRPGFLDGLRETTRRHGALLIFDEVMTGFRVAYPGAQVLYNVEPDLTCLGKVIGGGLPVGAYGGRRAIMEKIAPAGPIYQAGTLSGNPLAMAAGLATLRLIAAPGAWEVLDAKAAKLVAGLTENLRRLGLPYRIHRVGAMFTMFFTDRDVVDLDSAMTADTARFSRYFQGMLDRGIHLVPSQFEANFVSLAHTDEDIERTVLASFEVLRGL